VADKQYIVVRGFRYVDPRTGDGTTFEPGDPYTGPASKVAEYLDPMGPDLCGPLIAEKTPDKPAPVKSADKSASKES
jgi:hypothetical protein